MRYHLWYAFTSRRKPLGVHDSSAVTGALRPVPTRPFSAVQAAAPRGIHKSFLSPVAPIRGLSGQELPLLLFLISAVCQMYHSFVPLSTPGFLSLRTEDQLSRRNCPRYSPPDPAADQPSLGHSVAPAGRAVKGCLYRRNQSIQGRGQLQVLPCASAQTEQEFPCVSPVRLRQGVFGSGGQP